MFYLHWNSVKEEHFYYRWYLQVVVIVHQPCKWFHIFLYFFSDTSLITIFLICSGVKNSLGLNTGSVIPENGFDPWINSNNHQNNYDNNYDKNESTKTVHQKQNYAPDIRFSLILRICVYSCTPLCSAGILGDSYTTPK